MTSREELRRLGCKVSIYPQHGADDQPRQKVQKPKATSKAPESATRRERTSGERVLPLSATPASTGTVPAPSAAIVASAPR